MVVLKKIEEEIDFLCTHLGSHALLNILQMVRSRFLVTGDDAEYSRLLRGFIVNRTLVEYDLPRSGLETSSIQEFRQARMTIFHLLHHYGGLSFPKIATHFSNTSKYNVRYGVKKCHDYLNVYSPSQEFVRRYRRVEADLILFTSENLINNP